MRNLKSSVVLSGMLLVSNAVSAGIAPELSVDNAWIREVIPGTEVTAAYMTLVNRSLSDMSLSSVSSPCAQRVEIHEHTMKDGMMRMQQVAAVKIDAQSHTKLQPGGYHIMMFDLTRKLQSGEDCVMTFSFSDSSQMTLKVPIQQGATHSGGHHHHK